MKKEYFIEIIVWIVFLTLFVGATFGIKYYSYVKEHTYTLAFSDIDGIIQGSPVRFSGMVIGHVRTIKVVKDRLLVQIIITKPQVKIPGGSTIRVEFTGLGGSKSIEVRPPTEDGLEGIIVESPIRIRDFMDSLEVFSKILIGVQNMLLKLSAESTKEFFIMVKQPRDMSPIQRRLDEAAQEEEKLGPMIEKMTGWNKFLNKVIENFPKRKSKNP